METKFAKSDISDISRLSKEEVDVLWQNVQPKAIGLPNGFEINSMTAPSLQNLKIQLQSHAQFVDSRDAFQALGYRTITDNDPFTAPYIYAHSDGRLTFDNFDSESADLSSADTAHGSFVESEYQEITFDELMVKIEEYYLANPWARPRLFMFPLISPVRPFYKV